MKIKRKLCMILTVTLLLSFLPVQARINDVKVTDAYMNGKLLLIPVQFSDISPVLSVDQIYDSFKNLDNPLSIASYIKNISYGKFGLDFGSFNPNKWLKLKKTKYQYEVREGTILYEPQPEKLVNDAITLAIENGLNVDEYDKDKNGRPDCYVLMVAGTTPDECLWNCVKVLSERPKYHNDNYENWISEIIDTYVINSGLEPLMNFDQIQPLGMWDVSAYTIGKHFVGMNAFNRWKLGLLDFKEISEPGIYDIDDLNGDGPNKCYKIKMPGTKDEWILLENRQKTGIDNLFDGIPGTGIVMYHYDNSCLYDFNFNQAYERIGKFSFGLKVFDSNEKDKLHLNAAWSTDVGKTEMSWRNSKDNEPLFVKNYTGLHVKIKNISKSGPKMTFELAYENNSPDHLTEIEKLDFGNVRKGIRKTLKVPFAYSGNSSIQCSFFSNNAWIAYKPDKLFLGQAELTVTVETSDLDFGMNTGKILYKTDIADKVLEITVNVTNPVGDVNGDLKVDMTDFDLFKGHYGKTSSDVSFLVEADFNGDGWIDLNDFFLLSKYFQ